MTTATVVGPADEEIFTDAHGRIKIQFHWQRPQDHPEGGASLDDHSSTWGRVAYPGAGAAWGDQYLQRIGQEVTAAFLENDIDRPLVTGVVYNGTHCPPTFAAPAGRRRKRGVKVADMSSAAGTPPIRFFRARIHS